MKYTTFTVWLYAMTFMAGMMVGGLLKDYINTLPVVPNYHVEATEETSAMIEWPSIFTIEQGMGSGTGFMVGPELVLTAAHVVSNGPHVCYKGVTLRGGPILVGGREATILRKNPSRDMALLKVPGLKGTAAQFNAAQMSEKVWFVGDVPRFSGPERVVHQGYVADMDFDPTGRILLGGASAMPGMSGGSVMNDRGNVIGMVVAIVTSYHGGPNYGNVLTVPAHDLVPFIEEDLNAVRQADPAREGVTPRRPNGVGVAIPGPGCATVPPMAY